MMGSSLLPTPRTEADNMQGPLCRHLHDIDESEFWAEADSLEEFYRSHVTSSTTRSDPDA